MSVVPCLHAEGSLQEDTWVHCRFNIGAALVMYDTALLEASRQPFCSMHPQCSLNLRSYT